MAERFIRLHDIYWNTGVKETFKDEGIQTANAKSRPAIIWIVSLSHTALE
jgi:hypothetical protein